MSREDLIARDAQNKQVLLASTLLAKATIRLKDGSVRILAVYGKSTRYEFWSHQTKAKTSRAPRKSWIRAQTFARDFNTDYKPYTDFKSFVAWYTARNSATLLGLHLYKARRLAALYLHTDHEACSHDWSWTPALNSTDPRSFRKQNKRLGEHIAGRVIDWER